MKKPSPQQVTLVSLSGPSGAAGVLRGFGESERLTSSAGLGQKIAQGFRRTIMNPSVYEEASGVCGALESAAKVVQMLGAKELAEATLEKDCRVSRAMMAHLANELSPSPSLEPGPSVRPSVRAR